MPHILLTSNTAFNLAHFRRPLWETLLAAGHQLSALAPAGEACGTLEQAGIHFYSLNHLRARGQNPWQEWQLYRELYGCYKKLRPDLILHFTVKPNIWGTLAAARAGIPSVANVTGLGSALLHPGWRRLAALSLYRQALCRADALVTQNPDDARQLREAGIQNPRWALIPGSGIDTEAYRPRPRPTDVPFTFLYLGRMLVDKGLYELGEAWRGSGLAERGARLLLAGWYEAEQPGAIPAARWNELLHLPGLSYIGPLADVRPAIAEAEAIVLPSYGEGMPRTLLEALSMERPAIATDVSGCKTLVIPEKTGWLAQPRDAISLQLALTAAYHSSAEQRAALGRNGRQHILNGYRQEIIAEAYLSLIASLLR